jgi:DNA (cytosine-5)-methyltransferase 1
MNDVDTTKTITHLSLCTGYEGIGLGLRRVLPDVREIAYVEIEAFAIANLANKIEKGWLHEAPIYTNLKTFPYRKFCGRVDVLSGGFPCQPFSVAGNKKATEDPRHLFPYIAKGIRECEPRIVFLENVEGIISSKTHEGQSVLQYVLGELEEMGYRAEAGIFSASEVGAPHQRKRVFILGVSNSEIERWRGWNDSCNDDRNRLLSSEQERREVVSQTQGCSRDDRELVYTESECDRLNKTESQGWNTTSSTSEGEELGNTTSIRLSRSSQESREVSTNSEGKECRLYESQGAGTLSNDESFEDWPARPNEEQYEWEEPRVVKTEPRLGGATDGLANRVDRLRLLGNGVVPATAAKAFTTLTNRINAEI